MQFLYKQKEMTASLMRHPQVQRFVSTTASVLNQAVEEGIRIVPPSPMMVERLKESNLLFSGFKTFHELNEAFPSLLDADGDRKPFEQFLNDVQKVDETYNSQYLKAEYNFAVASAQMAAKWEKFAADGDRYNLQYRTANDDRVRDSHAALHNVTLPVGSPFWDEYFPPNGWGCRCTVVQVRKSKYPLSDESKAIADGNQATAGKHQELFRFNPGKRQACYPDYNPYTIKKCSTCAKAGLKLAKVPDNELCAACKVIREMKKHNEELKLRRKDIQKEAAALKPEAFQNPGFNKEIHITGKGIKEWLNQPHKYHAEKNEMLLHIKKVIREAEYLGHGTDKHDAEIVAHLFETVVGKEKSWIIVREYSNGEVNLHSISDNNNILKILE